MIFIQRECNVKEGFRDIGCTLAAFMCIKSMLSLLATACKFVDPCCDRYAVLNENVTFSFSFGQFNLLPREKPIILPSNYVLVLTNRDRESKSTAVTI